MNGKLKSAVFNTMIKLKVRYYGMLTDIAGCSEEEIRIDPESTVGTLQNLLNSRYPTFSSVPVVYFSGSRKWETGQNLTEGMEIECMPPFSGG